MLLSALGATEYYLPLGEVFKREMRRNEFSYFLDKLQSLSITEEHKALASDWEKRLRRAEDLHSCLVSEIIEKCAGGDDLSLSTFSIAAKLFSEHLYDGITPYSLPLSLNEYLTTLRPCIIVLYRESLADTFLSKLKAEAKSGWIHSNNTNSVVRICPDEYLCWLDWLMRTWANALSALEAMRADLPIYVIGYEELVGHFESHKLIELLSHCLSIPITPAWSERLVYEVTQKQSEASGSDYCEIHDIAIRLQKASFRDSLNEYYPDANRLLTGYQLLAHSML